MIFIDFETRSECIIQKTGAARYAEDPSTDVMCMAYAIDDGPVQLWVPGEDFPFKFKIAGLFEAHHSFFERMIWRKIMVPRYGWPDIPDSRWRCSAATAMYHALPRALNQIGAALGLKNTKDMGGKRVMMKLSRPAAKSEAGDMWSHPNADFRALYQYCKDDVSAERDVHTRLRPLPPLEQEIWALDQRINERGIRVDMPAVRAAITLLGEDQARQTKRFKFLTDIDSPTEIAKFKVWLEKRGCPMESLNKNAILSILADKDQKPTWHPSVIEALEIRQALGKTSTAKYQAIENSVCKDGRIRGLLQYHGASTGRWTGQLVQVQNLPRNTFRGNFKGYFDFLKSSDFETFSMVYPVAPTLSKTIRGVFIPSDGYTFYGGDYNAIEARVLFWLASESRGLNMFRNGEDIYKDLAATIHNTTVDKVTPAQRNLGKRGILGCGYGLGAKKFKQTCWDFARVEITDELAERVINAYRTKYRTVAVLWQMQEMAARQAVETRKQVKCGKVVWGVSDGFLFCKLPSGRCLAYYDPKIEAVKTHWGEMKMSVTFMGLDSITHEWTRQSTYGGKICENLSSAVARDILAEAMLRCEGAGYKILMSVHDEILSEKETGHIKEFESLMSTSSEWSLGIPIKVEGWAGERYVK